LFFPSYRLLETCYEIWQNHDLVSKISKAKPLLREPKDPAHYQLVMDRYYSSIFEEKDGGAILMGVCRGRISEGLDFSDNAARCVMIVGIPYPQIGDARIVLKKDYLDRRCRNTDVPIEERQLNGKDWYN
jgi:regulator of telomere elongation helicase 1